MSEPQERPRAGWRWLRPRSIRARVTVWAVAVLALIVVVVSVSSYALIRETVLNQLQDRASETARQVTEYIMTNRYEGAIPATEPIVRLQIIQQDTHEVLAASNALRGLPALTYEEPPRDDFRMDTIVCGEIAGIQPDDCLQVVGYAVSDSAYGDVIVLAATRTPQILAGYTLGLALSGMSLALLAVSATTIWYGVGRALRPVENISEEIDRISVSDLHRRVPVPPSDDEIAHLARTANAGLGRLEDAMVRQRRFVSDASHELRNPIAGMRTKLEVELSDPEPDQRARERLLTGLLSDTERLENIVSDLLELARLDTDVAMSRERLELGALVTEEFVDPRRHPQLRVHGSAPVHVEVNRLRLVRVLTNLIANAERHADSRIDVIIGHDDAHAVVEVHDDGAGIPVKDRERVFERFSRLSESKKRDPGGSGLGLPISREIVHAYGGTLVAGHSDMLGGALFTLRIPDRIEPTE
ncbi:cell wall metabolism sensor histidine kinase WalK [Nocardiopsis sp. MG754419]|uniref:sensor histidine kinase n=1 Tax=Nocardiopsis sp. MG754419 TaxID=2259865 RepID=UPI001BABE90D|nr:ATP-binding protein [Nocardiopsis sp. MG754419]MBR8742897.1 two-component sensor histidine kinase [Nocardiopsis sp. MG754419]